jgi:hypothetical protein
LRNLIRSYVGDVVAQEWSVMARRTATLQVIPYFLAEALRVGGEVLGNTIGEVILAWVA